MLPSSLTLQRSSCNTEARPLLSLRRGPWPWPLLPPGATVAVGEVPVVTVVFGTAVGSTVATPDPVEVGKEVSMEPMMLVASPRIDEMIEPASEIAEVGRTVAVPMTDVKDPMSNVGRTSKTATK